ncbi:MAG TPA: WecB/TagA/CpsF family glycosyltransferase [Chitinophagaceae bacterium]
MKKPSLRIMVEKLKIVSLHVHHLCFNESLEQVTEFALQKRPSYVCFANVHMTIEAYNDRSFLEKVNSADLVLTDGKPVAIACKLLYHKNQDRICGMDFIPSILEKANEKKLSIFVYGSTTDVITSFKKMIARSYSDIRFAGSISPPFRPLTVEETKKDIEKINGSEANLVFVALGCPKQEKWMAENSGQINASLLGIGRALSVVAGLQKRAPKWMQNMALEWVYRVIQQPQLLFKRYFYTNSYFIFLLALDWAKNLLTKNRSAIKNNHVPN